jgi:hypothetical protein
MGRVHPDRLDGCRGRRLPVARCRDRRLGAPRHPAAGGVHGRGLGAANDTGVSLVEVYSVQAAPGSSLSNISSRQFVGTGGNVAIPGFVVGGSAPMTVLIRASGPVLSLAPFDIAGTLPDPLLQLYKSNSDGSSTLVGSNAGWGGSSQVVATASSVGAYTWPDATSADSALLATLPPGAYTAVVSGASGDTGVSLVELYAVP